MAYGMSGPHIECFREGWAIMPFVGGHCKPHYWQRKDLTRVFTSLCGMKTDQERFHPGAQRQFAPGVFMVDRCKNCRRKHERDVERPLSSGETMTLSERIRAYAVAAEKFGYVSRHILEMWADEVAQLERPAVQQRGGEHSPEWLAQHKCPPDVPCPECNPVNQTEV